jgi:holo-[acyl-carrier protein] synthase
MRIGTDLVKISRISNILKRSPRFATLVYTHGELQRAESFTRARREQFLAGRFAVKEAVLKALGVGIGDLKWMREIEVDVVEEHAPKLMLLGTVAAMAEARGLLDWQVSISHEAGLAAAFVILT